MAHCGCGDNEGVFKYGDDAGSVEQTISGLLARAQCALISRSG